MNNEILFDKLKPVYPMDTRKKKYDLQNHHELTCHEGHFNISKENTCILAVHHSAYNIHILFGKTVAETSSRKQISLICNKFKPDNFKSKLFFLPK